ncbi:MAG: hypothetical protein R3E46_08685 [Sedimenticolaceae bacterium]
MKAALRESPDVILMGEIRDQDTMKLRSSSPIPATWRCPHCTRTTRSRRWSVSSGSTSRTRWNSRQACRAEPASHHLPAAGSRKGRWQGGGGRGLINTGYIADLIAKLELGSIKDAIERGAQYKIQSFDQHLVSLYREGGITEETAIEYADSASNVKIQIKTVDAGKKLSSADWSSGLSLEPTDRGAGKTDDVVAQFGKPSGTAETRRAAVPRRRCTPEPITSRVIDSPPETVQRGAVIGMG